MSIGAIGKVGEQARIDQLSSGPNRVTVIDLNTLKNYAAGQNAPAFDLVSSKGFESVKTYSNVNQAIDHLIDIQADKNWETSDMRSAGGKLANAIAENRAEIQKAGAWPENLPKNATAADIRDHLRQEGKIALPDGIAEQVKAALPDVVRNSPALFGLKITENHPNFEAAAKNCAAALASRVVNFGKTVAECAAEAVNAAATAQSVAASISNLTAPQPVNVNPPPVDPPTPASSTPVTPIIEPPPMSGPSSGPVGR
jgi:hypothetical protein